MIDGEYLELDPEMDVFALHPKEQKQFTGKDHSQPWAFISELA